MLFPVIAVAITAWIVRLQVPLTRPPRPGNVINQESMLPEGTPGAEKRLLPTWDLCYLSSVCSLIWGLLL